MSRGLLIMHVDTPYTYEKMHEYPHMRPADESIWNRFLEKYPKRFTKVWYDFHVGDGEHECDNCAQCQATGWWDLTRWKCDVVATDGIDIYCIEVKPAANAKAVGQAMAYAALYEEEQNPVLPVKAVVLTDHVINNTQRIATRHGVELWVA